MTALEKKKLINEMYIEADKNHYWKLKEKEEKWCEYKQDNYILKKYIIIDDCVNFKGYIYLLKEIHVDDLNTTQFLVAKVYDETNKFKYYYERENFIEHFEYKFNKTI